MKSNIYSDNKHKNNFSLISRFFSHIYLLKHRAIINTSILCLVLTGLLLGPSYAQEIELPGDLFGFQRSSSTEDGSSNNAPRAIGMDWVPFARNGQFKVYFPSNPSEENSKERGVYLSTLLSESSDPMHLFRFNAMKLSSPIPQVEVDNFLFSAIRNKSRDLGFNPSQRRRIQDPQAPGCTFKIVCDDMEWDFMIRVIGCDVYTLSVCSEVGAGNDGYADFFFKSFSVF